MLEQLQEIRTKYSTIKLIAHRDIDDKKVGKYLLDIGFLSYLPVGSDAYNFRKVVNIVANSGRYLSTK